MTSATAVRRARTGVFSALLLAALVPPAWGQVATVAELVDAVTNGAAGDQVVVAAGTYELTGPLRPKAGMTIVGAGAGQTVLTAAASWSPGTAGLPDGATNSGSVNRNAYLVDLGDNVHHVTVADLTLRGPALHGAITGNDCDHLEVRGVSIEDVLWSGIRTFRMDHARIHGSTFVDAGGQYGTTGGAIYATWFADSEIWDNTFRRSSGSPRNVYGIKGRQAKRVRIHHNTIRTNFSIELPHENDQYVEIDHNYVTGTISIPKHGGGSVPTGGYTFHIHHNYSSSSYALEWARNGAEVDHNLFDFSVAKDGGNLISSWTPISQGPTRFHHNLIKNPGRGVFWSEHVFNHIEFANNHVVANETVTPRTDGFFGLNPATDFSTVTVRDNIFEVVGRSRGLMRNAASRTAVIENNRLVNVSDTAGYANPQTGAPQGLTEPLAFRAGASGEYEVDGWDVRPYQESLPPTGQTVSLRAETSDRYVAADLNRSRRLVADRAWVRGWEQFEVTDGADADPATVALRARANGRFVTAAPGTPLAATATSAGPGERFAWEPHADGTVCLKSLATGAYAAAGPSAPWTLDADGAACPAGARFAWATVGASVAAGATGAATTVAEFGLDVYPNPAHGKVSVAYTLVEPGEASVSVYDVLGRRVADVATGHQPAGAHRVGVDVSRLSAGAYVVRLASGGAVVARRLTVAR